MQIHYYNQYKCIVVIITIFKSFKILLLKFPKIFFSFLSVRYMLGLSVLPAALQFIGFLFLPESPRWLIQRGLTQKARRVLSQIRGNQNIDEEYDSIKNSLDEEESGGGNGGETKHNRGFVLLVLWRESQWENRTICTKMEPMGVAGGYNDTLVLGSVGNVWLNNLGTLWGSEWVLNYAAKQPAMLVGFSCRRRFHKRRNNYLNWCLCMEI